MGGVPSARPDRPLDAPVGMVAANAGLFFSSIRHIRAESPSATLASLGRQDEPRAGMNS